VDSNPACAAWTYCMPSARKNLPMGRFSSCPIFKGLADPICNEGKTARGPQMGEAKDWAGQSAEAAIRHKRLSCGRLGCPSVSCSGWLQTTHSQQLRRARPSSSTRGSICWSLPSARLLTSVRRGSIPCPLRTKMSDQQKRLGYGSRRLELCGLSCPRHWDIALPVVQQKPILPGPSWLDMDLWPLLMRV
jgi:hypothetical protein